MILINLRANKGSFHPVTFNRQGISLIVAKKRTDNDKNTYNSVGKSLTIALVHFCLASSRKINFETQLFDWIFYLDFEVNGVKYTSERSTANQDIILLNGEEKTLNEFRNIFEKEVFGIKDKIKYISFRSLISRFIRQSKESYNSFDKYINKEEPFSTLLNNSYLLGLDINKILKKQELKTNLDNVKKLSNNIKKDSIMKSFFLNDEQDTNIKIKIVELERKISFLQNNLDSFIIADDYNEIKKEADKISARLYRLRNESTKMNIAINNINNSLQIKADIKKQDIIDFYNQANIELGELIVKRLDEVENFNLKIIENRAFALAKEKEKFENNLDEIKKGITILNKQEDEKLQYLNSHGALEDYTNIVNSLSDYKAKLNKLKEYQLLIQEYKTKKEEVKKEFINEDIATDKYLIEIDELIKHNISIFQSLSEEFYENKTSGITIDNHTGENSLRFNIDAKIMDDTGDGVNDVKIFCFDWTILKCQYNHNVKFLFHDSRLLSENDPRQVAKMIKIAYNECKANNFQYILTINQSTLDLLKNEFDKEEYEKLIDENEILELNDISDENKLLGFQIDLDYTK